MIHALNKVSEHKNEFSDFSVTKLSSVLQIYMKIEKDSKMQSPDFAYM